MAKGRPGEIEKARAAFPNPAMLRLYKDVDPDLPKLIIEASDRQLEREYKYASRGQWISLAALAMAIAGFVYLVMQNHPKAAGVLLGAGVIGLISGYLNARLSTVLLPPRSAPPSGRHSQLERAASEQYPE
jgi:hypothetical protein